MYESALMDFVGQLQEKIYPNGEDFLPIYTMHTRETKDTGEKVIFRSSRLFHERVWTDWVMINFEDTGKLPCHIAGFLDFSHLTSPISVNWETIGDIEPGYYAIVECGEYVDDEPGDEFYRELEFFAQIEKEVWEDENGIGVRRKYFLYDVETFEEKVAVLPNIGESSCAYFVVKPRREWTKFFVKWLKEPHGQDEEMVSDSEFSKLDAENEEEEEESEEEEEESEEEEEESEEEEEESEEEEEESEEEEAESDEEVEELDEEEGEEEDSSSNEED